MGSEIVLELRHRRNNPRNSEGAFVTLADGRIMFAWSRYYGKSWSDDATADLAARWSSDGGRTWSPRDKIILKNEGGCNVMSVSLLRLQDGRIALFYLRKDDRTDCHPFMRVSSDEGRSWGDPVGCIFPPGYFVVNNDRVIQLRGGRLIVPAAFHRSRAMDGASGDLRPDGRGLLFFYYSDDVGETWHEAQDWWALPVRSTCGIQEPGVVELKSGTLYSWFRTKTGRQWQSFSRDQGDTWTPPEPSRIHAPCSPLSMKRIPSTGDLLAVWNDTRRSWKLPPRPGRGRPRHRTAEARGTGPMSGDPSWGRTPLVAALSTDDGKSWARAKLLEKAPDHGYCYTAIHFVDDAVLLAYCCGGGEESAVLQDMRIRRVTLDWLYA